MSFVEMLIWFGRKAVPLFFIIFFIYIILLIIGRRKQNKLLEENQQAIIRNGEINVKKFKLNKLFTSDNGNKMFCEGKIIAYTTGEVDGDLVEFFVVRNSLFNPLKFFVVPHDSRIGESVPYGDVILRDWNYNLDGSGKFYVLPKNKRNSFVQYSGKEVGVDTLGKVAPLVLNAILANPYHRLRMRESRLIKLPEQPSRLDSGGNI